MKKKLWYLLLPLFAIFGAILFLNLFGQVVFHVEALQIELSMGMKDSGYTRLTIPPVGEIRARTHRGPLDIRVALQNIDLPGLKKTLAETPQQQEIIDRARPELTKVIKKFVFRALVLGLLGGLFGVIILQRRRPRDFIAGGLIGLFTVAVLLANTYYTYDAKKFQNPQYDGMLKAAPWMIGLVQQSLDTMGAWGKQLRVVTDNLYGLFERMDTLETIGPAGEGDLKVLHVSDIHNNPAAFDFIEQVVKTFGVDMVIDTGDLSDFGTPIESAAMERLKKINVPYIITPGNHETAAAIGDLQKIPNVRVLTGGTVNVKGLDIAGIADPAAYTNDVKTPDARLLKEYAGKLRGIIDRAPRKPVVVAVHNHRLAREFAGKAPVVLHGHDHRYKIDLVDNTVLIDAGTTGAAGFGGLETKKETPFSVVLVHFRRDGNGFRPVSADTIKVSNLQSGFSLERRVFSELYAGASGGFLERSRQ